MKLPVPRPSALRRSVAAVLIAACGAASAQSQPAAAAEGNCALRVATGPVGKVYERLFEDLRQVCGSAVAMCPVRTEGGLQNLMKLSANEADVGIAQVDTLHELRDGDPNVASLQAVSALHANLLHVLSLTAGSKVHGDGVLGRLRGEEVRITRFTDLRGRTVALVGSAQLSGRRLDRHLGYGMRFVDVDTEDKAIELLKAGSVQAVFSLGGWPLPSLQRLRPDGGLRLVEFNLPAPPGMTVIKRNYQNLDALNHAFLATPNLLLTRGVRPDGTYGRRVAALQACLKKALPDLQDGAHHPAWREIRDLAATTDVPLFGPATLQAGRGNPR